MRGEDDDREPEAVLGDPGRDLAVQAQAHAGVGEQHQPDGEDEHQQLGLASAARQRDDRVGGGAGGVAGDRGHPAAPCKEQPPGGCLGAGPGDTGWVTGTLLPFTILKTGTFLPFTVAVTWRDLGLCSQVA